MASIGHHTARLWMVSMGLPTGMEVLLLLAVTSPISHAVRRYSPAAVRVVHKVTYRGLVSVAGQASACGLMRWEEHIASNYRLHRRLACGTTFGLLTLAIRLRYKLTIRARRRAGNDFIELWDRKAEESNEDVGTQ